eukprot:CAMPEP_0197317194 /NCGR_PEP_ID=MMETSP0891-20130614/45948_1 /TAXON_ID=44058 ORGANISM="Aureoumbra lagunensis, Strain CCMP1510" /NCGR_SAMPLE_ID=MMETSP0891 /ASSEMBLY_ACC=CAM_ASM_000534 /LENGTH=852 /DNA_ID=CAMNT_0042807053 /DNA_START=492 /DNA_END=3050 /DNA_ORIENTATION=-
MHWVAYALANHLAGATHTAVRVIDAYLNTTNNNSLSRPTYEDSELALYRNSLLEELEQYHDALTHLDTCRTQIVDITAWALKRAQILTILLVTDDKKIDHSFENVKLSALLTQDDAISAWLRLLTQSSTSAENYSYHRGLQTALLTSLHHPSLQTVAAVRTMLYEQRACQTPTDFLALDDSQTNALNSIYELLQQALPQSQVLKWIPVTYAYSKLQFITIINDIIIRQLRKGAPSIGSSLERLFEAAPRYTHDELRGASCCKLIISIVDVHIISLKSDAACFASLANVLEKTCTIETITSVPDTPTISNEPPTSLLWTLYLKAHCLEWLGNIESALQLIHECLRHTPTAVDIYEKEARLLKRSGDLTAAATSMDNARCLDLADRYINNKAIKYFLRDGQIDQARKAAALFTRPEARDAEKHLRDMQASWYELELGQALAKDNQIGPALRQFAAIIQHFSDFIDDQFDFHTYCVRKMTLRAYVDMLRFEERIRGHAAFRAAAQHAAYIWLNMYDEQERKKSLEEAQAQAEKARMSALAELASRDPEAAKAAEQAAQQKSAQDAAAAKAKAKRDKMKQRKAKKAQDKAAAAASNDGNSIQSSSANNDVNKKDEDDDPQGVQLLATARDPLIEANDLVTKLNQHAAACPRTHALAFDLALRRRKPLLALRALQRLKKIQPIPYDTAQRNSLYKRESPRAAFIERLAHFIVTFSPRDISSPVILQVMNTELVALCDCTETTSDWRDIIIATIQRFANEEDGLPARTAATRALAILDASSAQFILTASLVDTKNNKPYPVDAFISARDSLRFANIPESDIETFLNTARTKFPRAQAFALPSSEEATLAPEEEDTSKS